jgi:hypothetical protein
MGYLTTFTIYNDDANGITKDPTQFADKIDSLIGTRQFEEFHTTTGVNGFVQQSRHADEKTIYVNAGNCVTEVNPYSKSFKELIKKNPDFARELVEFVEAEVVNLKKVFLQGAPNDKLTFKEKKEVANNSNTPPETLDRLANDENSRVRYDVARNPNTPPEALNRLANDDHSFVRCGVAQNPNTSTVTLDRLANDGECHVRCAAALNPNTSTEILERLANDDDVGVRYHVATNPNTPPETLERLANDASYAVRHRVAWNPNTPPETLKRLLNDKNTDVRCAAWEALQA